MEEKENQFVRCDIGSASMIRPAQEDGGVSRLQFGRYGFRVQRRPVIFPLMGAGNDYRGAIFFCRWDRGCDLYARHGDKLISCLFQQRVGIREVRGRLHSRSTWACRRLRCGSRFHRGAAPAACCPD